MLVRPWKCDGIGPAPDFFKFLSWMCGGESLVSVNESSTADELSGDGLCCYVAR